MPVVQHWLTLLTTKVSKCKLSPIDHRMPSVSLPCLYIITPLTVCVFYHSHTACHTHSHGIILHSQVSLSISLCSLCSFSAPSLQSLASLCSMSLSLSHSQTLSGTHTVCLYSLLTVTLSLHTRHHPDHFPFTRPIVYSHIISLKQTLLSHSMWFSHVSLTPPSHLRTLDSPQLKRSIW
jgi:hypothetical protein